MTEHTSPERFKQLLENIPAPGLIRTLGKMNILQAIDIQNNHVTVTASSTALNEQAQIWLRGVIPNVAREKAGYSNVKVNLVSLKPEEMNEISHTIAVISGKGGVGKSLVSVLIAVALRRMGQEVGILDADINCSSIPGMLKIKTEAFGNETGILPGISESGIEVISFHFFIPHKDAAITLQESKTSDIVRQFRTEVVWGKLDYLIIDLPSGISDVALTVLQTIPLEGILIVFTPGGVTSKVVYKTIKTIKSLNKRIIGIIENMSFFTLPDTDKKVTMFGTSRAEEISKFAQTSLLAQIPFDANLLQHCDSGRLEEYQSPLVEQIGEIIIKATQPAKIPE